MHAYSMVAQSLWATVANEIVNVYNRSCRIVDRKVKNFVCSLECSGGEKGENFLLTSAINSTRIVRATGPTENAKVALSFSTTIANLKS